MEKLITDGKTKMLYDIGNGLYKLYFKDDMTGVDGVFDPGANEVGLTVEGAGIAGLGLSAYFFEMLTRAGFDTHYVSADIPARIMVVRKCQGFGKGLEVICRYRAIGSFFRRYGTLVEENAPLPALVEMTIKSDAAGDPLITQETLETLGVLVHGEYEKLCRLTRGISNAIKADLEKYDLELCDIKLEFGRDVDGSIILIDELSAGNMRVRENDVVIKPLELARKVLNTQH